MRKFFAKYGWTLVYLITSVISIGMFMSIFTNSAVTESTAMQNIDQTATADIVYQKSEVPTVSKDDFIVYNEILPLNSDFDYRDYVTVSASNGIILNSYVSCREVVSYDYTLKKEITKRIDTAGNVYDSEDHIERKFTSVAGEHELIYTLNWNGYTITKRVTFTVSENEYLPITPPLNNSSVILVSGEAFRAKIPSAAKTVRFTDISPEWVSQTYDLSEAKDAGVIGWLDGTTWYVSTRREGLKVKANEDCSKMFQQKALADIDMTGLDTSSTKNMSNMFNGCSELTSLNISEMDTVNCTNMGYMFSNCSKLTSITGIGNLNTAKVTDMGNMFNYCSKIEQLDLSSFNTENVDNMSGMFHNCSKLKTLDLSSFTTTKVKNMTNMFTNNLALESLNIYSFNTPVLTDAQNMFADCVNLKTLDLTGFNMSNVSNANGMFSNMRRLYKVTFGSLFKFVGSSSYLPTPSNTYITGADGKWYVQYSDTGYTNTAIPQNVAGTYIAVKDVSLSINGIRSKTYDGKAINYDAIPLISEGTTLSYSLDGTNYSTAKPEIKNAGNYKLRVKAVNPDFADKVFTTDFTVSKAPMTLSSGSASKTYDGAALTKAVEGCTLSGLVNGETASASCTGSITNAGSVTNSANVNWGTANAENYNITKNEGTLSVAKKNITLTTNGTSKTYDGIALTYASGSISGLVNGETASINYTGSQTNAGTSMNTATINWIGTAKAANYNLTSSSFGNLTVAKKNISLTTNGTSKTYDGKALTYASGSISGLVNGETANINYIGSQTNAGTSMNTATINWNGTAKAANYNLIGYSYGNLTVAKKDITLTTMGKSKTYDGAALKYLRGSISGLVNGETASINYTGSQTNVGTSQNTATINWNGTAKAANYNLASSTFGNLTVNKLYVSVEISPRAGAGSLSAFSSYNDYNAIVKVRISSTTTSTTRILINGTRVSAFSNEGIKYSFDCNVLASKMTLNIQFVEGPDQGYAWERFNNKFYFSSQYSSSITSSSRRYQHFRVQSHSNSGNIEIQSVKLYIDLS